MLAPVFGFGLDLKEKGLREFAINVRLTNFFKLIIKGNEFSKETNMNNRCAHRIDSKREK